jgi:hypothetical protein
MKNLFYVLLIPVGALFVVTAFAYGYMSFQQVNSVRETAYLHAEHPLFQWLRAHGDAALLGELAALGVLTVLCIACDRGDAAAAPPQRQAAPAAPASPPQEGSSLP